ncbi:helix-turn-helix domain-containing protein [Amycolatopsis sp. cg5]|uniref:helix-turn-helix domain-containing protein n=1 Tax=Amycolatopsis sp. cg5 TaxID=3238802 RepID=UPI0035231959
MDSRIVPGGRPAQVWRGATIPDVETCAFIKGIREHRQLSVEEVCRLSGIASQSLLRFESGARAMRSLDAVAALADVLDVSRSVLALMVLRDLELKRGGWE